MRIPFSGTIRNDSGPIVSIGCTVAVFLSGTETPADIYAAVSGGAAVHSVTSDSKGQFLFFIDTDDYSFNQFFKVVISGTGLETTTIDPVSIPNAATETDTGIGALVRANGADINAPAITNPSFFNTSFDFGGWTPEGA